MLRFLFLVLAVVAAGLAYVMGNMTALYAAALGLAVIALALFVSQARERARARKMPYSSPRTKAATPLAPSDPTLESLGIGEVRPREPKRTTAPVPKPTAPPPAAAPPSQEAELPASAETNANPEEDQWGELDDAEAFAEVSEFAPPPPPPPPDLGLPSFASDSLMPSGTPRSIASKRSATSEIESRTIPGTVAEPLMQSVLSALGAHTAVLLRRIGAEQFAVDAIHSISGEARGRGCTFTPGVALAPRVPRPGVSVRDVSDDAFPRAALGYYRTPPSVRQLAYVPVSAGTRDYLLLVDSVAADAFSDGYAKNLLAQFAAVLSRLAQDDADDEIGDTGAPPDAPRAEPPDSTAATAPGVRPRREIIAEEMEAARATGSPLALVLLSPNASDAVAESGPATADAILDSLRDRLRHLSPEFRVERFGELMLGVFYPGDAEAVAEWAQRVQDDVTDQIGPLREGVIIGAAVMQPGDTDPQALRDDATQALTDAYATGEALIYE